LFDNCKVTKAGSIGLSFITCTKAKVINCELSNNYFYGLEFRDCESCKAIGNDCYQNGITGLATSTGGRGIMLWRSRYCYIAGNRMAANTEYGFRIYSEAADATTSNFNVITGNVFADNTACDFVIYDEGAASSFTAYNVISDNTVYRTTNATIGAVFTLHGDYNTYVNNHVFKCGAFGTGAAFNFYNANYCTISNSSANNIAVAFSTSSSANITIENCLGYIIANALTVPTANISVKNCKFIHGGGGGSDVAIINYATATGKNYYEGNIFQDFNTGIYIASEAVAIFRNTTINSGFAGLRLTGNNFSLLECGGNSWDITQPYLLSAMTKTVSTYDQATTVFNIAPTTITWAVGARVYNSAPAVGQPKSWVCTVAGTPGTWVSEGNL
jgi:parallel beta-helix repeat protein